MVCIGEPHLPTRHAHALTTRQRVGFNGFERSGGD